MTLLCEVCDRSIIEKESENYNYLAILRKKDDKSLYKTYTTNNINLDEVNKILNDYISIENKYSDFYFINYDFVIQFDNNFIANINTIYFYNTGFINENRFLLYDIDCLKSRGHKFYNINQMTIIIISYRCNMTYEHYINQPMSICERKINMNKARNPHLINSLDRKKIIILSESIYINHFLTNNCI